MGLDLVNVSLHPIYALALRLPTRWDDDVFLVKFRFLTLTRPPRRNRQHLDP